jgi:hypothetical protein
LSKSSINKYIAIDFSIIMASGLLVYNKNKIGGHYFLPINH